MKAYLILEDGHIFEGESFGAQREIISEFVFNTSMTGYLEVLSDPSYAGQSVVMTYPLIGNYGVCLEDQESSQPYIQGLIVNELARVGSHFRKNMDLEEYYTIGIGKKKVALYDFGAKKNIAKELVKRDCIVTVYPATTSAADILKEGYDGIMLSNGPGDPSECVDIINQIKILMKSGIPIFAICLGHQLMALANGFQTEKLKYGHHGANHPVKDLSTGRVYISTQNHNYVVKDETIDSYIAKPWFRNVNDQTIEGIEYIHKNIKTVQFHPEACAGPLDTSYLFDEFMKMMEDKNDA